MFYARSRGLTLVEILVALGIIAVLIAILLPAVARIRRASQTARCASNLSQIGKLLEAYSVEFNGALYPPSKPNNPDDWPIWFKHIPGITNIHAPFLSCNGETGYALNGHLYELDIKRGSRLPNGLSTSDCVLGGEEQPEASMGGGHYVATATTNELRYDWVVDPLRHGHGSNLLMLDGHVQFSPPRATPPRAYRSLGPGAGLDRPANQNVITLLIFAIMANEHCRFGACRDSKTIERKKERSFLRVALWTLVAFITLVQNGDASAPSVPDVHEVVRSAYKNFDMPGDWSLQAKCSQVVYDVKRQATASTLCFWYSCDKANARFASILIFGTPDHPVQLPVNSALLPEVEAAILSWRRGNVRYALLENAGGDPSLSIENDYDPQNLRRYGDLYASAAPELDGIVPGDYVNVLTLIDKAADLKFAPSALASGRIDCTQITGTVDGSHYSVCISNDGDHSLRQIICDRDPNGMYWGARIGDSRRLEHADKEVRSHTDIEYGQYARVGQHVRPISYKADESYSHSNGRKVSGTKEVSATIAETAALPDGQSLWPIQMPEGTKTLIENMKDGRAVQDPVTYAWIDGKPVAVSNKQETSRLSLAARSAALSAEKPVGTSVPIRVIAVCLLVAIASGAFFALRYVRRQPQTVGGDNGVQSFRYDSGTIKDSRTI